MGVVLQILLFILKLLGILLLIVLGVLLLVLIVPIRYRAEGEAGEQMRVSAKVTWLLHLLSVGVTYQSGELTYGVRVLGIKVFPGKPKPVSEPEEVPIEPGEAAFMLAAGEQGDIWLTDAEKSGQGTEPAESKESTAPEKTETVEETEETDPQESTGKKSKKAGKEKKEKKEKKKTKKTGDKVPVTEKIAELWKKVQEFKAFLEKESTHRAIRLVRDQIFKILRHILPQKLHIKGIFGLDDPSTTGQITGVLAALMPLYRENIQLQPDFTGKHIEGEFWLKGRIRLGIFVVVALRLLFDRTIRSLLFKVLKL